MKVTIHGDALHVKVGDNELDMKSNFPLEMYIGVTACEGINKFYSLEIDKEQIKD